MEDALGEKLIITVAPLGNVQGKKENPAIPYTPAEIAEAVYESWNEGASVAHIHCRDARGVPTSDPVVYQEVHERIRAKNCDIILDHSTTGPTMDEGMRSLETNPEIGTLTMGVSVILSKGKAMVLPRDRYWLEGQAREMGRRGIKPNLEVFNLPMMEEVENLIEMGLLQKPYWISLIMGTHSWNQSGTSYSIRGLMHHIDSLPKEALYCSVVQGEEHMRGIALSILLGGNCRSGFEDTLYFSPGRLAESNAQLIGRIRRVAKELGREAASPEEARIILGLASLDSSEDRHRTYSDG